MVRNLLTFKVLITIALTLVQADSQTNSQLRELDASSQLSQSMEAEHVMRQLQLCHSNCATCTGPTEFYVACNTCNQDFYKQNGAQSWVPYCPTGSSIQGEGCTVQSTDPVIDVTFFPLKMVDWTSEPFGGISVQGGPNQEEDELDYPVPIYNRGVNFENQTFLQIGNELKISQSYSVMTWIMPRASVGTTTIYIFKSSVPSPTTEDSYLGTTNILTNSGNEIYEEVLTYERGTSQHTQTVSLFGTWNHIAHIITWSQSNPDDNTTSEFFRNGSSISVKNFANHYPFHEDHTADGDNALHYIGNNFDGTRPYEGYMYRLRIFNVVKSTSDVQSDYNDGGCDSCSTCSVDSYWDGSTCEPCADENGACVTGCIRGTDCDLCFDEYCAECKSFAVGVQWCVKCKEGQNNVAPPAEYDYKFWVPYCPSGYSGTIDCTLNANEILVLSFVFDLPTLTFTNSGTAEFVSSVTFQRENGINSGQPLAYRGIFFNGEGSARAEFNGEDCAPWDEIWSIQLSHTFAVHIWAMLSDDKQHTLLSKDTDDLFPETASQHLRFSINANGHMEFQLAHFRDSTDFRKQEGSSDIESEIWHYFVYSVALGFGSTTIEFYSDAALDSSATMNDIYVMDKYTYPMFIGTRRSGTTTYSDQLHGFIYQLHVYQQVYTGTDTTHIDTSGCPCASPCTPDDVCLWNSGFQQLSGDDTACDATCSQSGCRRTGTCVDPTVCTAITDGIEWCNHCWDKECAACPNYDSGSCTVCGVSGHAVMNDDIGQPFERDCICTETHGRGSSDQLCTSCFTGCKWCNLGSLNNHSDCTECISNYFDIGTVTDRVFCVSQCPTTYSAGTAPLCEPTGNLDVLNYNFLASFVTFSNSAQHTSAAIAVPDGSSGVSATGRGLHFDGTSDGRVYFDSQFVLAHSFSIEAWVMLFSHGTQMSLFTKDTNSFPNKNFITLGINSTGQQIATIANVPDRSVTEEISNSSVLSVMTWSSTAYSLQQIGHKSTDFSFISNGQVLNTESSSDDFFISDLNSYPALIGLERTTGETIYGSRWNGYVYNFVLYNKIWDSSISQYKTNSCVSPCVSCPLDGTCLWNVSFSNWKDGANQFVCDAISCTGLGCRNQFGCNDACANSNCSMCYDFHCLECANHDADSCLAGKCDTITTSNSGAWSCLNDFRGRVLSKESTEGPCRPHGCSISTSNYFLGCSECESTFWEAGPVTTAQEAFKVCFASWATGFNAEAGTPNRCTGTPSTVVDLDLTQITRPFTNLAGYDNAQSASNLNASWTNPGPYKMRGAFFNGSTSALYIPNLTVHHTFSLSVWIFPSIISGVQTIFSKDKGDGRTLANQENFLEIGIDEGQVFISVWNDSSQSYHTLKHSLGDGFDVAWYYIALTVEFQGTLTKVSAFNNRDIQDLGEIPIYVEDSTDFVNSLAYIGATSESTTSPGQPSPDDVFSGFIYHLKLYNTLLSQSDFLADVQLDLQLDQNQCTGTCDFCPSSHLHCLWISGLDYRQKTNGTIELCDRNDADPSNDCTEGCNRREDCSLCNDPQCGVCTNFDAGTCTECKANTVLPGAPTEDWVCLDGRYWENLTDICELCHSYCAICDDPTNKTCWSCASGAFKSLDWNACFDFCPTGSIENSSNNSCGSMPAGVVFQLQVESWTRDFKSIYEKISGATLITRGASQDYGSDDPWLDRVGDKFQLQFTSSNSQFLSIEEEFSGKAGLLLYSSFTITAWVRPVITGTRTILSKINRLAENPDQVEFQFSIKNGFLNSSFSEENSDGDVSQYETSDGTTQFQANIWEHAAVTQHWDGTQTTTRLFLDGKEIAVASHAVMMSDLRTSINLIGCSETEAAGVYNRDDFFEGYLFQIMVYQSALTVGAIVGEIDTNVLPVLNGVCAENEYYDGASCIPCDENEDNAAGTVVYSHNECTICFSALCTQWVSADSQQCSACRANSSLSTSTFGECSCDNRTYDNTEGQCIPCHANCEICSNATNKSCTACTSGAFKQPDWNACFDYCPTGSTENNIDNNCGNIPTSVVFQLQVESWTKDFKQIKEKISGTTLITRGASLNYASDDPWLDRVGDKLQLQFTSSNSQFLNIEEEVSGKAGLLLYSTFTITAWVRPELTGIRTILSKINRLATNPNEVKFHFSINNGFLSSSFSEENSSGAVSQYETSDVITQISASWAYTAVTQNWDGAQTTTKLFLNGVEIAVASHDAMMSDLRNSINLIGCSETESIGVYTRDDFFDGYIFQITVYQSALLQQTITSQIDTNVLPGLSDSCSENEYYDDTSCIPCDQTTDNTAGTVVYSHNECTICFSALCTQCDTEDIDHCSACRSNSSLSNTPFGECSCDVRHYDDTEGQCIPCHSNCEICSNSTNKSCTACTSGSFKQPDLNACFDYCPTGSTENSIDNNCENIRAGVVFQLQLESWTKDFKQIYEIISGTTLITRGASLNYDSDDPWLDRVGDKLQLQFTSSNQQFLSIEKEASGKAGLLLYSSFTITAWVRPDITGIRTIISKINRQASNPNEVEFHFSINNGFLTSSFSEENSNGAVSQYETSDSTTQIQANTWATAAVTQDWDGAQTTTILFLDGEEIAKASHAAMMSDLRSTINLIGCSETQATGVYTRDDFFDGFIFQIMVYQSALSQGTISGLIDTNVLPGLNDSCSENEYYDGAICVSCDEVADDEAGTVVYYHNECSICFSALCTQCDSEDSQRCSACRDNTSLSNTPFGTCGCDARHYYDTEGQCIPCHANCEVCGNSTNKNCTACTSGDFLQPDWNACFEYCPTGSTENSTNNSCGSLPTGVVFQLQVESWTKDFKQIYEKISGTTLMTRGASQDYGSDDPWLDRVGDKLQLQFTSSNSQFLSIEEEASGKAGLLLNSSFTITAWVRPDITGTRTILSKINRLALNPNEVEFRFSINNGFITSSFSEENSNGVLSQYETSDDTTQIQSNTWAYATVTQDWDGAQTTTTTKLFRNGVEIEVASYAAMMSDFRTSINLIGCSETEFDGIYTRDDFFDGYIFQIMVYQSALSQGTIAGQIDTNVLPELNDSCSENEYYDGSSCVPCDADADNVAGTVVYSHNECSICFSALCTQCDSEDSQRCSACRGNTSLSNTPFGTCSCNSRHYDDTEGQCLPCHANCEVCGNSTNKNCTACTSGAFKQLGWNACFEYCPTGSTENTANNSCENLPAGVVFQLQVESWTKDFKQIYEKISGTMITRGASQDYGSDNPWLDRVGDKLQLQFTNSNSQFLNIEEEASGKAGLLLNSSFTITAWVRPDITGTRTILSKINRLAGNPNEVEFSFSVNNGYITSSFSEENSSGALSQYETSDGTSQISANTWAYAAVTQDWDGAQTTTKLFLGEFEIAVASYTAMMSDFRTSINLIGCSETESFGIYTRDDFFEGYIFQIMVYQSALSQVTIAGQIDTNVLPVLNDSCSENEYYDGASCLPCDEDADNVAGTVVYSHNECSICFSALCTQCDTEDRDQCSACRGNSSLSNTTLGECSCDAFHYDDTEGQCIPCHENCATCTTTDQWNCASCRTGFVKQSASVDFCYDFCPTGWDATDQVCALSQQLAVEAYFLQVHVEIINDATTTISPTFTSTASSTPVKDRGHFFDGLTQYQEIDRLRLAPSFTFTLWARIQSQPGQQGTLLHKVKPEVDYITLFSLFSSTNTNTITAETRDASVVRQSVTTTDVYTDNEWSMFAAIVEFSPATRFQTSTLYINKQFTINTTTSEAFLTEYSDSRTTLGCALQSGNTPSDFVKGYIYELKIYNDVISNIESLVSDSCSGPGFSRYCPAAIGVLISECAIDTWINEQGVCQTCSENCSDDNCVRAGDAVNCNLCADIQCTSCPTFAADAVCATCFTNSSLVNGSCECDDTHSRSNIQSVCGECDAACATDCFGSSQWECTTCTSGSHYAQPDSSFCYAFCPTGYNISSGNWVISQNLVLEAQFVEVHIDIRNYASTTAFFSQGSSDLKSTPAKSRGHYFDGSSQLWYLDGANPFYFHHTFTIQVWTRLQNQGPQPFTLFSKIKRSSTGADTQKLFLLQTIDNKLSVSVSDGTENVHAVEEASGLDLTTWTQLATVIEYSQSNRNEIINIWFNKAKENSSSSQESFLREYQLSISTIGASLSHLQSPENYLNGFIYNLKVYNVKRLDSEVEGDVQIAGCSGAGVGQVCPSAGSRISECDMGQWIESDGSCSACEATCGGNCVRSTDCKLCDNPICDTCQLFDSGADAVCLTCINNATVEVGTCACDEHTAFQTTPTYACTCVIECAKCTAVDKFHCSECEAGYYLQNSSEFCFDYCAQNYSTSGQTCIGSDQILRNTFNTITNPGATDPWPAKDRGLYFSGSIYISISTVLHHTGMVAALLRPISSGNKRTIFSRNTGQFTNSGDENQFQFYLRDNDVLSVTLAHGQDAYGTLDSIQISESVWSNVAVTWQASNDTTAVELFVNNVVSATFTTSAGQILMEGAASAGYIGISEVSSGGVATKSDGYEGFIYETPIANYLVDINTLYDTTCSGYGGCALCPLSQQCLSLCSISDYPDPSKLTDTCTPCANDANCDRGCVRSYSCTLCHDPECLDCANFDEDSSCSACQPGTSFTADGCECDSGSWYSDIHNGGECVQCHENCSECSGDALSQSLYDCTHCKVDYYMHDGICESFCPTGYNPDVADCVAVSVDALVMHYSNFIEFTSVLEDAISSHPAQLGYSTTHYPNRGSNAPMQQTQAGLYFDGDDILQISPYDTFTQAILLNWNHSIQMLIRPQASDARQDLFSKGSTDKATSVYRLSLNSDRKLSISVTCKSMLRTTPSSTHLNNFTGLPVTIAWYSIALTAKMTGNASQASLTFISYVDGVQTDAVDFTDVYFADSATNLALFGGSWESGDILTSYIGHLYDLRIYNYVVTPQLISEYKPDSDENCACAQCFDSNCMSSCEFNQAIQPDASCQDCPADCTDGCIRTTDCKLNDDIKCDSFVNSTACDACITLAQISQETGTCECVANAVYVADDEPNGICECDTDLEVLDDGTCGNCHTYIQPNEVSASYDEKYEKIELNFTVPVLTSTVRLCQNFVDPTFLVKLGSDVSCSWDSASQKWDITLGKNASVLEEVFVFISGALTTTLTTCNSQVPTLSPIIQYQETKPGPTAALVAPSHLYMVWSDLPLNAQKSRGKLGRSLEYSWTVVSDPVNSSLPDLSSWSQAKEAVSISKSLLIPGVMSITLQVRNWLGQTDTRSTQVTILEEDGLLVLFDYTDFDMRIPQRREFRATVTNNCDANSHAGYSYSWNYVQGDGSLPHQVVFSGTDKLTVLPYTLSAYGVYPFELNVSGGGYTAKSQIDINVIASELELLLNKPDGDVSSEKEILFSASRSTDPDEPDVSALFTWSCSSPAANGCVTQTGAQLFDSSATSADRLIPAGTIKPDVILDLTVTMIKGTRSTSRSLTINTFSAKVPTVYTLDFNRRVAAQSELAIQTTAPGSVVTATSWSQLAGPGTSISHWSNRYLVIREGVLSYGQLYTFQLNTNDQDGSALSTFTFNVNNPPNLGTWTVQPTTGTAFTTNFIMEAKDWEDDESDYPLTYKFGYIDEEVVDLTKPDEQTWTNTTLPAQPEGNLSAALLVYDSLESFTQQTIGVQVSAASQDAILQAIEDTNSNLPVTAIDKIPGYINVFRGSITEVGQMNGLIAGFTRWVDAFDGSSNGELTTTISILKTLSTTPVSDQYQAELLQLKTEILAKAPNGLNNLQTSQPIDSIGSISNNAIQIEEAMKNIGKQRIKNTLPDTGDYQFSSDDLKVVFRRSSPSNLKGASFSFGTNTILLPESILDSTDYLDDTTGKFIDSYFSIHPHVTGAKNETASVVGYILEEGGTYAGITLDTYTPSIPIELTGLAENVTITIEVDNIPSEDYNPVCLYDTNTDTTQDYKWSSEGCHLDSFNRAENKIVCLCNHLSRFTAGEGMEYVEPPPFEVVATRTIGTVIDEETESEIFPINMAFYLVAMTFIILVYKCSPRTGGTDSTGRKTADSIFEMVVPNTTPPRCTTPVSVSPPSGIAKPKRDPWGKHSVNDPFQNVTAAFGKMEPWNSDIPDPHAQTKRGDESPSEMNSPTSVSVESMKLCNYHLVFGGCSGKAPRPVTRVFLVCGAIIFELTLSGLAYWFFYDISEEYEGSWEDFSMDEIVLLRELSIGAVAAILGFVSEFILASVYARYDRRRDYFIHLIICLVCGAAILCMSVLFTYHWSLRWSFAFIIAVVFEMTAGQTGMMGIIAVFYNGRV